MADMKYWCHIKVNSIHIHSTIQLYELRGFLYRHRSVANYVNKDATDNGTVYKHLFCLLIIEILLYMTALNIQSWTKY